MVALKGHPNEAKEQKLSVFVDLAGTKTKTSGIVVAASSWVGGVVVGSGFVIVFRFVLRGVGGDNNNSNNDNGDGDTNRRGVCNSDDGRNSFGSLCV